MSKGGNSSGGRSGGSQGGGGGAKGGSSGGGRGQGNGGGWPSSQADPPTAGGLLSALGNGVVADFWCGII